MKVDKFIFPMDIILRRPFLATAWALIALQKGALRLRVQDEVTFNVFNAIKHPMESESCFKVDIVEVVVYSQKDHIDPFETSLIYGDSLAIANDEAKEYVLWIDSFGQNNQKHFESLV